MTVVTYKMAIMFLTIVTLRASVSSLERAHSECYKMKPSLHLIEVFFANGGILNCFTGCPRVRSHIHPYNDVIDTTAAVLIADTTMTSGRQRWCVAHELLPPVKFSLTYTELDFSGRGNYHRAGRYNSWWYWYYF